jgi:hypothetical protein
MECIFIFSGTMAIHVRGCCHFCRNNYPDNCSTYANGVKINWNKHLSLHHCKFHSYCRTTTRDIQEVVHNILGALLCAACLILGIVRSANLFDETNCITGCEFRNRLAATTVSLYTNISNRIHQFRHSTD